MTVEPYCQTRRACPVPIPTTGGTSWTAVNAGPSAPTHVDQLMCYQVKQLVPPDPAKFVKIVGVFVNNQFGPETLDVKKPALLCVPALTTL